MKFCIMSVQNKHGGTIVLETLCSQLNSLGHNAKLIYPCRGRHKWYKPFVLAWLKYKLINMFKSKHFNVAGCKVKKTPFIGKNTIVVYPDIVYGNPLKAKKVVRYMMYFNRFKDDEKAYGKDDLFFSYRAIFNDYDLNPTCRTLRMPHFDLDTYKRTNYGNRKGTCYIIRKGKNRSDLPEGFDGIVIDDLSETDKVKVFNECEYCISYDTQTAYSGIAAMCGCVSVVVPEPGKSRKDYLKDGDVGYGVAYGFDEKEIEYAIETRDKILPYYQMLNESSREEVNKFVQICKDYFVIKENDKNDSKYVKNDKRGGVPKK